MTGRKVLRSTGLIGLEMAAALGTEGLRGGAGAGATAGADVDLTVWTVLTGGLDWANLLGALVTGLTLVSEGAFIFDWISGMEASTWSRICSGRVGS